MCFSDVPSEEIVSRLCGTPESAVGQQFETDARPPRADGEDEYKFRPENGIRSTGDIFTSFNEIRVFIAVHVAAKYGSVAFKCRNTVFSLIVTMGYVRYSTLLNINAQLSTVVNDVFFSKSHLDRFRHTHTHASYSFISKEMSASFFQFLE